MGFTTQLRLDDELAFRAKALAERQHLSLNKLITESIERALMVEAAAQYNDLWKRRDKQDAIDAWHEMETENEDYER